MTSSSSVELELAARPRAEEQFFPSLLQHEPGHKLLCRWRRAQRAGDAAASASDAQQLRSSSTSCELPSWARAVEPVVTSARVCSSEASDCSRTWAWRMQLRGQAKSGGSSSAPHRPGEPKTHRGPALGEGADGREPDVGAEESAGGRPSPAGAPLRPTGPGNPSSRGPPPSMRERTTAELRAAARDGEDSRGGRTRRGKGFAWISGCKDKNGEEWNS